MSPVTPKGVNPFCALSILLGVSLIFVNPTRGGWLEWLYVPVAAGYGLSPFEIFAGLVSITVVVCKGLKIEKTELGVAFSLSIILCSRVISTWFAEESTPGQLLSLSRYVGIALLMFSSATLFSQRSSRTAFVAGVFAAALTEAIGGILITLLSNGEQRGILVSEGSYVVETFAAVWCLLAASVQVRFALAEGVALILLTAGIFLSLTRTGMILLVVALGVACCYLTYSLRNNRAQFIAITSGLASLAGILAIGSYLFLPQIGEVVEQRIFDAVQGDGSVLERYYLWDRAIGAFIEHPIKGIGSGGFARQQVDLPHFFGIENPYQYSDIEELPGVHNTVLGVASETGSLGLVAYMIWFTTVSALSLRAMRFGHLASDTTPIAAAILIFALLLSDFWAIGSFLPTFSIFAGLVLGWFREARKAGARSETVHRLRKPLEHCASPDYS